MPDFFLNKPLHILMFTEWYPNPEDPQLGVFIEKHARAAAVNHQVTLLYIRTSKQNQEKFRVEIQEGNPRIISITIKRSVFLWIRKFRYFQSVKKAIKMIGEFDLLHLQVCGKNALASDYFFHEKPMLITEHWSGFLRNEKKGLIPEKDLSKAFHKAKLISAVSEPLKESIENRFSIQGVKIIPNVIEFSEKKNSIHNGVRIVVVADLVDKIKNISGILEACSQMEFPENSQLVIIGDGQDASHLKLLAGQLTFHSLQVQFLGRLKNEDTLHEISSSDFLIMNSFHETFSMVTAEAIASGIPVIATRCGGPEQFVDPENGILIQPGSQTELIAAIQHMLTNYSRYDAETLRKSILDKYGFEKVSEILNQIYSEIY